MRDSLAVAALCGLVTLMACAPASPGSGPAQARVQHDTSAYALVPLPRQLTPGSGWFVLDRRTRLVLPQDAPAEVRGAAERWAEPVRRASGLPLPIVARGPGAAEAANAIRLRLDPQASGHPEGYRLAASPDGITVAAARPAGLFYGLQTLRQLLPAEVEAGARAAAVEWRIPAVAIDDAPRFAYRGLHLDVGRHFFPVEFIKKYLDLMALYKLNTFHWHLTEDQGWRLEIRKYPRLTEVGGCRRETMVAKNFNPYVGDGTPYCGSYTQEEAREIVAYARERFITVIPEIEMPGHSLAALAAYPQLACTPGPFEVATTWGVFDDVYCPSEETFAFLQDVLTEVMEMFPSEYIHIGGDEAPKKRWQESSLAQDVIRREELKDEHELQSYFIQRIGKFLDANGRRLIGWDEILEGGLAPNATVMSWRGTAGGIEAARQGHDVVMTPVSHLYFDYYQGDPDHEPLANGGYLPLRTVYGYEPIPDELTPAQARHVLGAQANVWTEYLRTAEQVEYMVFPRLLALAEVVWSPRERRGWNGFVARLGPQLDRLTALGVRYRVPDVEGLGRDRLTLGEHATLELRSPVRGAQIRYTLDGSEPTRDSRLYEGPLRIPVGNDTVTVRARLVTPEGRLGAPGQARLSRTRLLPAAAVAAAELAPGLQLSYHEGTFRSVDQLRAATPLRTTTTTAVGLQGDERPEHFGLHFSGYLNVPADGIYTFSLASDDGSKLFVAGQLVIDHDGFHGMTEKLGEVALRQGFHPFEVLYFQAGGGAGLELRAGAQGEELRALPAASLFHRRPE